MGGAAGEKRHRAAAVQNLTEHRAAPSIAKRRGVRQPSAALEHALGPRTAFPGSAGNPAGEPCVDEPRRQGCRRSRAVHRQEALILPALSVMLPSSRKRLAAGLVCSALFVFARQSVGIFAGREDFGLQWRSATATPHFGRVQISQSSVALRFPPYSRRVWSRLVKILQERDKPRNTRNTRKQNSALDFFPRISRIPRFPSAVFDPSLCPPSRGFQLRPFKAEPGFLDVDEWSQIINVRVAVAVERIEGVDVQRGRRRLGREGDWSVQEVIVAIDQGLS